MALISGRVVPSPTGIRSVYLSMHPLIRQISVMPAIISLIRSLISGQPGYGGGMVRERDADPQVQRQTTSSTGEREKEWGGG
jgi:hypothetical protein